VTSNPKSTARDAQLVCFCDVLLSLYQSLTFTEEANKLLRNSLFPPVFDSNETNKQAPASDGSALSVSGVFKKTISEESK
jgi:hypothetical protein